MYGRRSGTFVKLSPIKIKFLKIGQMPSAIDIAIWDREEGDRLGEGDEKEIWVQLGSNFILSLPWVTSLCPVLAIMLFVCFLPHL